MYYQARANRGFTLIELLVVLAIVLIIAALSFLWFPTYIKKERVKKEMNVLVSYLEEARSKTLSAKSASQYGVRTETNQIIFFEGANYSVSDPDNIIYTLDSLVYISIGSGINTVFQKLTGNVVGITGPRYFALYTTDGSFSQTILIHPTGIIEKN